MPCFKPLEVWRGIERTKTGKRPVVFKASLGFGSSFPLPCGKCIGCRLEYSRQWAVRCVHEAQLHEQNCFLTLTYAPEHLPPNGGLVPKHFTDFMKRFRRWSGAKVLYYMCGEYGSRFRRPHYHSCLFGYDFSDRKLFKEERGVKLYTSEQLDKLWKLGYATIGDVTFESAAYISRYVTDKLHFYGERNYEHIDLETGEIEALNPEYSRMSLKPAVGLKWFEQYGKEVYTHDEVIMRGREMKPPRYYDKMLEIGSPKLLEQLKAERLKTARARSKDATPERLRVREEVKKAQLSIHKREMQ